MIDIKEEDNQIDTFNVEKTNKLGGSFLSRTTQDTTANLTIGQKDTYVKLLDEEETTNFTFTETLKFAPEFYFKSIPLIFNRICPLALNMVSMYFISFYENPALTAGFGMGHSLFMFFFMMFTLTSCEAAGI